MSSTTQDALPDAGPPIWARLLAVSAIIIAGVCGGLIGWSVVDLQCTECNSLAIGAGIGTAIVCAVGVAVVAVLSLRAMAEWKALEARDRARRARGLS